MKRLIDYIYESVDIKTANAFKKDIDIKLPSTLKYKNGIGKVKLDYNKYNDFTKGLKYIISSKYRDMEFLGKLKDESGLYSLDGGETISGSSAIYRDNIINTESGNKYLFRELTIGKDIYLVFKLIDNERKEPMFKAKEIDDKLNKLLPYDMPGEEVLKKYFKVSQLEEAKAKFPGPEKDIIVEIRQINDSMFGIYINNEKKVSNNKNSLLMYLSGDSLKKYLMDVVIEWYKKEIK